MQKLGTLGFGREKSIRSRDALKSLRSAENGIIDSMHIAYALYCDVFLTCDRAAYEKFHILNKAWGLGKKSGLFLKEKGAP